ncbi:MAG: hypothetical protein LKE30_05540 [Bacteroidales bacterium]|jgi:hypothetical protein|nr:hypothetical protein [Bacteroidales bacterium]
MNKLLKTIILVSIISLTSLGFTSCNDEQDNLETKARIEKQKVLGDNIPNGTYNGYYYTSNGDQVKITETFNNNVLTKRIVNGVEDSLDLSPTQYVFMGRDCNKRAYNLYSSLKKDKYATIYIVRYINAFANGDDVYILEYSNTQKGWYDKYITKRNTNFKGIKCAGDKVPDGAHFFTRIYRNGQEVTEVYVFKNNYMIRKYVNWQEKDLEHGEF